MQMMEQKITSRTTPQPALVVPGKLKTYPRGAENHKNPSTAKQSVDHDQEYLIKRENYKICLVNSHKQRSETNKLIKDRYASKGYLTDNSIIPHQNLHQITLEASNDQHLFGTITLTIDSSNGLLADKLYASEINGLRDKYKTVFEISKFASHTEHGSKEVFAALFHLAFIYGHVINDIQVAVIEVNPRHAFFYKRMLGFQQIGEERICKRVNAPAVLLHLDLNYMSEQIISLSHQSPADSRTIYPYFLSQHEEKRLVKNLEKVLYQEKNQSNLRKVNTQSDLAILCH